MHRMKTLIVITAVLLSSCSMSGQLVLLSLADTNVRVYQGDSDWVITDTVIQPMRRASMAFPHSGLGFQLGKENENLRCYVPTHPLPPEMIKNTLFSGSRVFAAIDNDLSVYVLPAKVRLKEVTTVPDTQPEGYPLRPMACEK